MGVVVERVEKQIGAAVAGEMLAQRQPAGEHQPAAVYAARLRFPAEIGLGALIVQPQPQHAAFDPGKQSHPDIEFGRRKFVAVVERTEDDTVFRQSQLPAREHPLGGGAPVVRGEIAVRQIEDFFGEESLVRLGHDPAVGEDVIHEIRAHGAGKAEIIDLDGRRAAGENIRTGILGVAHQVDGDVDAHFARQRRDTRLVHGPHVVETIRGIDGAAAHLVLDIRAEGEEVNLETAFVMFFEQSRHVVHDRVVVQVGGEIANTQFRRTRGRAKGECGRRGVMRGGPFPGTRQQVRRIGVQRKGCPGLGPFQVEPALQQQRVLRARTPVADGRLDEGSQRQRREIAGFEMRCPGQAGDRLLDLFQRGQRHAAIVESFREIRPELQRLVKARQRLLGPLQRHERDAALVPGSGMVGGEL